MRGILSRGWDITWSQVYTGYLVTLGGTVIQVNFYQTFFRRLRLLVSEYYQVLNTGHLSYLQTTNIVHEFFSVCAVEKES